MNARRDHRTGRELEHDGPQLQVRSCLLYGKSRNRLPVIWKMASPIADWTDVARSWPMPSSQCSVGKKRMLISGGSSSRRDSLNVLKLFSTMCPSLTVLAWCMASL